MMKKNIDFKVWSDGGFCNVYVDYNNIDKYYDYYGDHTHRYTSDKLHDSYDYDVAITMKYDAYIYGFITFNIKKNEDSIYLDIYECSFEYSSIIEIKPLFRYLYKLAKHLKAEYIRISTKEDFPLFYEYISYEADYINDDCYIIDMR